MLKRNRKLSALCGGVLCTLALGGGLALAATGDHWVKGANQAWAASSPKTTFTSQTLSVTCTQNAASGHSVGSGPDTSTLAMDPPVFAKCKDNAMQSDTVKVAKSGWKIQFVSDKTNAKCPKGTGSDDKTTKNKDCLLITVPKDAATIKAPEVPVCTITVQPNGPTVVGATVADSGNKKDTFTLDSVPIAFSCGPQSGTAKFSGTYTLSKPNDGVLVDSK